MCRGESGFGDGDALHGTGISSAASPGRETRRSAPKLSGIGSRSRRRSSEPPSGRRGVLRNSMLPAGFEPASEARKAPILDRTRLRERMAALVPKPINAFGDAIHG